MIYKITELVDTVSWANGLDNAPAELVAKAKQMADSGAPATFGRSNEHWVLLSVDSTNNQLYIAARG